MDYRKVLFSGVAAGVLLWLIGMAVGSLTATWYLESATAHLWKPMAGDWFVRVFVLDLAIGIILAGAYNILAKAIPLDGLARGAKFGLMVWFLVSVPGMGLTYLSLAVPEKIIVAWLATGFLQFVLGCTLIALIQEKVK